MYNVGCRTTSIRIALIDEHGTESGMSKAANLTNGTTRKCCVLKSFVLVGTHRDECFLIDFG